MRIDIITLEKDIRIMNYLSLNKKAKINK